VRSPLQNQAVLQTLLGDDVNIPFDRSAKFVWLRTAREIYDDRLKNPNLSAGINAEIKQIFGLHACTVHQ